MLVKTHLLISFAIYRLKNIPGRSPFEHFVKIRYRGVLGIDLLAQWDETRASDSVGWMARIQIQGRFDLPDHRYLLNGMIIDHAIYGQFLVFKK
jgi:hypothetical protein